MLNQIHQANLPLNYDLALYAPAAGKDAWVTMACSNWSVLYVDTRLAVAAVPDDPNCLPCGDNHASYEE